MLKRSQEFLANLKIKSSEYLGKEDYDNYLNYKKLFPIREEPPKNIRPSNEGSILLCIFYFTISVISCKILFAYREFFRGIFAQGKRILGTSTKGGESDLFTKSYYLLTSLWAILAEFNWLLIPALAGLLVMIFSWHIVYLDSSVPGVQPPTPFSPSKYMALPLQRIHTGYMFGLIIGVLCFLLIFLSWNYSLFQ